MRHDRCDCCRHRKTKGGWRAAWRLAYRILVRVVFPSVVFLAVLTYRWLTGAPLRPDYQGRRLVTRPVRALGQIVVTAVGVGLVANWVLTVIVTGGAAAISGGTVVGVRLAPRAVAWRRERLLASPRRVKVTVGQPVRPEPIRAYADGVRDGQ